ncbi:MAG TPA: DUF6572 domain-containing protein [Candidatus Acidoferrales bacterium]|nr:DUF6572 domain-containing protein [Candidatus Acidoferrales bacterium]
MSIDQPNVVDIVSIDVTGHVVLTVSDHLDWSDTRGHLLKLQAKINTCLAFVESGEILRKYPDSNQRGVVIEVVGKYAPEAEGLEFLRKAKSIVEAAGYGFRFEIFSGASPFEN